MAVDPISSGNGTPDDPWRLKTPPLSSDYTMHRDVRDGVDVIMCRLTESRARGLARSSTGARRW
jgi:hypothetical protein